MKPRERKPQKQSSRLYLRHNDHRDMIMNDIYHNALVWVDENGKAEIIWKKYPRNALFFQDYDMGIMDLDREWQNGVFRFNPQTSSSSTSIYIEKFKALVNVDMYGRDTRITQDGMVFENISDIAIYNLYYYGTTFADDCICQCNFSDYSINYSINIAKFDKDEDDKWTIEFDHWDFVGDGTPRFISRTVNGIIVREQANTGDMAVVKYVHIGRDGVRTVMFEDTTRFQLFGSNSTSACYGNKLLSVSYGRHRVAGNWGFHVLAITSNDGGMTWKETSIDGWGDAQFYFGANVCDGFIRDGIMYIIYGHVSLTAGITHLLKSVDGETWVEVPLPNTVTVEFADVGNYCDRTKKGELVTIAFTPDGTQDVYACGYIQTGTGVSSYNIKMKDGEFVNICAEPFFYCMRGEVAFYTESEYLIPKICWYRNRATEIPEEVQPEDYCVRR